jgi:CheY-like chemotaxis protein
MTESKPTIIVVDDDPMIGKCLTMFLDGQGYRVIFFTDGNKALAYLADNAVNPVRSEHNQRNNLSSKSNCSLLDASNGVNFLLTDMQMPEMSGLELLRQVKALYPALPALVMSGSADGRDRDEIFALGADFIPKPFDLADLLQRIEVAQKASSNGLSRNSAGCNPASAG